jgi:hypothetical protein
MARSNRARFIPSHELPLAARIRKGICTHDSLLKLCLTDIQTGFWENEPSEFTLIDSTAS